MTKIPEKGSVEIEGGLRKGMGPLASGWKYPLALKQIRIVSSAAEWKGFRDLILIKDVTNPFH